MVLTMVLLVVSTLALPVEIGTSSPTCSVAAWLSMTTIDGFDRTLTLVTACSASRMTFGCFSGPIRKLKPGKARLRKAPATPAATPLATLLVALLVAVLVTVGNAPGGDVGMLLT